MANFIDVICLCTLNGLFWLDLEWKSSSASMYESQTVNWAKLPVTMQCIDKVAANAWSHNDESRNFTSIGMHYNCTIHESNGSETPSNTLWRCVSIKFIHLTSSFRRNSQFDIACTCNFATFQLYTFFGTDNHWDLNIFWNRMSQISNQPTEINPLSHTPVEASSDSRWYITNVK